MTEVFISWWYVDSFCKKFHNLAESEIITFIIVDRPNMHTNFETFWHYFSIASKHSNTVFFLSSSGATPNSSEFLTKIILNGAWSQVFCCILLFKSKLFSAVIKRIAKSFFARLLFNFWFKRLKCKNKYWMILIYIWLKLTRHIFLCGQAQKLLRLEP